MDTIELNGNTYSGNDHAKFIHSGGTEKSNISNITFKTNKLFSFIEYKNFYDYSKKTITLTKDESLIKTGQFSDNTMHSSIMDFIGNVIDL